MTGEATWQVPSLSLADEAVELFAERARLAQPGFTLNDDNAAAVAEVCRRLDGMPLAIELAAARVRALSLAEIFDSLHDRFRLLTGGSRTAVRRQQTLRASVDWSRALLTETERLLFRRLAVFLGGFDLDAAQAVAGAGDIERYQILDQLSLLVDKALLDSVSGAADSMAVAEEALAIARDGDDPALVARALTACGLIAANSAEVAGPYFAEAIGLARELGDRWRLSHILAWQATVPNMTGEPIAARGRRRRARTCVRDR